MVTYEPTSGCMLEHPFTDIISPPFEKVSSDAVSDETILEKSGT